MSDEILISQITVTAKTNPHPQVLAGNSGRLVEDQGATHITVIKAGSTESNGGPQIGQLYKIRYNVAGEFETVQKTTYIGFASAYQRYVFSKNG